MLIEKKMLTDATQGGRESADHGSSKIGTGQDRNRARRGTGRDVGHKDVGHKDVGINSYAVGRRRPVSTFVEKD